MDTETKIHREIRPADDLVPLLNEELYKLPPDTFDFLHSSISQDDDQLRNRILEVQQRSYIEYPYPCIRSFHFIWLSCSRNEAYLSVLDAGRAPGSDTIFLDLGCCMGTDVRKLVYDGYPGSHVLGCDLRRSFIDEGYKLYGDRETCPIRFFTDDIFELSQLPVPDKEAHLIPLSEVTKLEHLRDRVSHLYAGALFHLFDEPTQAAIAHRFVALVRKQKGTTIFGKHQARAEAGFLPDHMGRVRYTHSPATWTRLWKEVFTLAGGDTLAKRIEVKAALDEAQPDPNRPGKMSQVMFWSVTIT